MGIMGKAARFAAKNFRNQATFIEYEVDWFLIAKIWNLRSKSDPKRNLPTPDLCPAIMDLPQGWAKFEIMIKEKRELREKPKDLWQKTSKIKNFRIQTTFIKNEVDWFLIAKIWNLRSKSDPKRTLPTPDLPNGHSAKICIFLFVFPFPEIYKIRRKSDLSGLVPRNSGIENYQDFEDFFLNREITFYPRSSGIKTQCHRKVTSWWSGVNWESGQVTYGWNPYPQVVNGPYRVWSPGVPLGSGGPI